jgi:DNA-binding LytR/AlgR family response regulator
VIRAQGCLIFVRTEEIDWIEASENYVNVHVGQTSYLRRQTICSLEPHPCDNVRAQAYARANPLYF